MNKSILFGILFVTSSIGVAEVTTVYIDDGMVRGVVTERGRHHQVPQQRQQEPYVIWFPVPSYPQVYYGGGCCNNVGEYYPSYYYNYRRRRW